MSPMRRAVQSARQDFPEGKEGRLVLYAIWLKCAWAGWSLVSVAPAVFCDGVLVHDRNNDGSF